MENYNMEGFGQQHEDGDIIEMDNAAKYNELVDSINMLDARIAAETNSEAQDELIAEKAKLEARIDEIGGQMQQAA